MKNLFLILSLLCPVIGFAQSYSVDWYKISGGGGTSTNGQYSVSGTIGQPDAIGGMSGGNFSVTGGFWATVSVMQMPGVPNLLIIPNGANRVTIVWSDPATNTYTLQQNANLALTNGWVTTGYAITNGNSTNFCPIVPPSGNLFFRLKQ